MVRRIALGLTLLLGLSGLAWAGQLEDQAAEIEDILQLVSQGVSDEVIIKHIEARGFVYDLSADDILQLRDRGLSEDVIGAMLNTAIDGEPSQRQRVYEGENSDDVDIYLGAGYFSPWYYYPYAWSYYYDPFPLYYSTFYYPFAFSIGWGWYGSSSYWYPNYWYGYGWCDPYYWDYAYCRPGCYVPYPHSYASRWESGRGLPSDREAPSRVRAGESVDRAHQGSASTRHAAQPVTRVRQQGTSVSSTRQGQPATQVREGQSTARVRQGDAAARVRSGQSADRVRTPSTSRGSQPAVKRSGSSATREANRSTVSRKLSRERVHTRSTTPSTSKFVRPGRTYSTSRRSESSVAPRSEAPAQRSRSSSSVRAPRTSSGSSVRAPSSGFRAPSLGGFSRPSAPSSHGGGRVSSPRGGGGGGPRR